MACGVDNEVECLKYIVSQWIGFVTINGLIKIRGEWIHLINETLIANWPRTTRSLKWNTNITGDKR